MRSESMYAPDIPLDALSRWARKGRYGANGVKDTRLAHINAEEDALLRAFGGEGSINPKTGLPEYKGGGGGGASAGRGRDGRGGAGDGSDKGGKGGNQGGFGPNGTSVAGMDPRSFTGTVGGQGTDSAGFGLNRKDLARDNIGNPDVDQNARDLKDKLDKQKVNQTNQTPGERQNFMSNLHNMQTAYNDSLDDGVFGLTGLTPFREINPYDDPGFGFGMIDPETQKPQVDANWGLDSIGLGLGLGSLAFAPLNIVKGLWGLASSINGGPPVGEVNMGSSVMGLGQKPSTPQTRATPDISQGITPGPAAASRADTNNRIGGYSGGGYNMGAFGKKPNKKTNYLSQQLMNY